MLINKNNNDFKSRFLEVTVYNNLHILSPNYTRISHGPPASVSRTPRGPRTTVWETLHYRLLLSSSGLAS